jgi:hypothetical protein
MAVSDTLQAMSRESGKDVKTFSMAKAHTKLNEIKEVEVKSFKDVGHVVSKLGELVMTDIEYNNALVIEYNRHVLINRIMFLFVGFVLGAIIPSTAWLVSIHMGG